MVIEYALRASIARYRGYPHPHLTLTMPSHVPGQHVSMPNLHIHAADKHTKAPKAPPPDTLSVAIADADDADADAGDCLQLLSSSPPVRCRVLLPGTRAWADKSYIKPTN